MAENGLQTIGATAEEFGVHRETISDLIHVLALQPKAMTNGKAKGLDAKDRKLIGERLRRRQAATAGA